MWPVHCQDCCRAPPPPNPTLSNSGRRCQDGIKLSILKCPTPTRGPFHPAPPRPAPPHPGPHPAPPRPAPPHPAPPLRCHRDVPDYDYLPEQAEADEELEGSEVDQEEFVPTDRGPGGCRQM